MNGRNIYIFLTSPFLTFKQIMQAHNTILMTITMTNTGTIAKVGIPTLLIISTLLSSIIGNHIVYSKRFVWLTVN